eukprot:COSAG02_NODE_3092_length_7386_cov_2.686428_2_plen_141_part_00
MLQHPGGYGDGATVVMPDASSAHAIHFLFNGDNAGPHSVAQVDARYTELRSQYPNAVVTGSTWDGFLSAIDGDGSTRSLPVVKKEEGDTWICKYASIFSSFQSLELVLPVAKRLLVGECRWRPARPIQDQCLPRNHARKA